MVANDSPDWQLVNGDDDDADGETHLQFRAQPQLADVCTCAAVSAWYVVNRLRTLRHT